jgi:RNA polymerase sigma-70 factor (ECF subfamily)
MSSSSRAHRADPERAAPAVGIGSNPPSFAAVYERYFEFVWASVRRNGVAEGDVDDVVQEVFVVIHAKLPTLRQPESLRSWVYGIVRRTVSHHRRSQRADAVSGAALALASVADAPSQASPQALTEQAAQMQLLWSLLAELDDTKREVFILAEVEEMTAAEIAEALEIPQNTVYSRLRTARAAFEAALARHEARSAFRERA